MTVAWREAVVLVHLAATLGMAGVIWYVQVVHYPLMRFVAADRFPEFHEAHEIRTGFVVVPLMLAEAGSAALLLVVPGAIPNVLLWLGMGLLVVIWSSTAWVQVPCHRRLGRGFDAGTHRRLIRTNWIRTMAWSARAVVALMVAEAAL